MSYLQSLALALLLTIFAEYAVYLIFIRRDPGSLFLYSVLINSFTNPLINYLYAFEFHELYALEMMAVIAESFLIMILMEISYLKALLISSAANLTSLLLGLIIFSL